MALLSAPKEVLAPIRTEEGVRDAQLEDGELGARLQVDGLSDIPFPNVLVCSVLAVLGCREKNVWG